MYHIVLLFEAELFLNVEIYVVYLLNKLITYQVYVIFYVHHQQLNVLLMILINNLHLSMYVKEAHVLL